MAVNVPVTDPSDAAADPSRLPPPGWGAAALHLFALSGFAIAQPLYDLLGRYPTFFAAHAVRPAAIVGFVLGLSGLVPLLIIGLSDLVRLFGRRAWWAVHLLCVGGLVGLTILPPLNRAVALPPALAFAIAALGGGLAARAYAQRRAVRQLCSVLAAAAVVFPLVFLFSARMAPLLRPELAAASAGAPIANPAPVVMIVFDELALPALLDAEGRIDATRFPNFAKLAQVSTWYRNATTVADYTPVAVPALLTGQLPDHNRIPVSTEHPNTLFSRLTPAYRLVVMEPVTHLCAACVRHDGISEPGDPALLFADTLLVWLHMQAPPAWRARLPDIGRQWTYLFEHWLVRNLAAPVRGDRPGAFRTFLKTIMPSPQPTLWFAHVLLPHYPYEYFPSGRRYNAPPADFRRERFNPTARDKHRGWGLDNMAGAAQERGRYLLQLGLVDELLGNLLAQLENSPTLYERSLVIVTADHGVSFEPGKSQRFLTASNADDILRVPLFIKAPGQRGGAIDDRNVQTIDVLPTIAAMLGAPLSWRVDGLDLTDADIPRAADKVAFTPASLDNQLDLTPLRFPPALPERWTLWQGPDGSAQLDTRYGDASNDRPFPELIGRDVSEITFGAMPFRVELADADLYRNVTYSGVLPAFVRGRLTPRAAFSDPPVLAIALNGRVVATTRAFVGNDGQMQFGTLLPEKAFANGVNQVEVLGITAGGMELVRFDG
jgi:hypothetical protein